MANLVRREQYLESLRAGKDATGVVKVVTGMRRSGKSTLFGQYMDDLRSSGVPDDRILSINFDALDAQDIKTSSDLNKVLSCAMPAAGMAYVFLDEIQNVEGWEKSVAALCATGRCDVYVTGSNSKMLSAELTTHISGRFVEIRMLPLSFKEYLELHPSGDLDLRFREYVRYGSLPDADPERGERFCDGYLEGVFNTVLVKDILGRLKTDEVSKIESVARFLYSNIGNVTNIASIAKGAGISGATADRYVSKMEESLLFYRAEKYDVIGKRLLETNGKYYASDLGMRSAALKGAGGADFSRPLENVVFLELVRRGYNVRVGSFRDREVDFAAFRGDSVEYYQVAATMLSDETRGRELRPLNGIRDNFRKTIITMDRVGLGSENGIDIVNLYDWLLGRHDGAGARIAIEPSPRRGWEQFKNDKN
ncbi:MAG: ATP-binding protein [Candidatus Methanoplasma sp.]|jgi:predicted AAA+ superfamily ATPase|nr:ATP-binding protein [Candidatus Methanoplasma sp.]